MNKEKFIDYMDQIEEAYHILETAGDVLHINIFEGPVGKLLTLALRCMAIASGDTVDDWIDYYAWELDWGRKEGADKCITDLDGKVSGLTCFEELWDMIQSNKSN